MLNLVLFIIWEAIFLILFTWSIFCLYKSIRAYFWPAVCGEVIDATIGEEEDSDGDTFYLPKIHYRYAIGNLTYQSTQLGYGIDPWAYFWVVSGAYKEAMKDYPKVIVKYNPASHCESAVLVGIKRFHIASSTLYALFGLLPIYKWL